MKKIVGNFTTHQDFEKFIQWEEKLKQQNNSQATTIRFEKINRKLKMPDA